MTIAQIKKEISLLTTAIENALNNGGVTTMKFENIEIGLSLTVLYDRRDRLENKLRNKVFKSNRNFIC